ncbi:amidohydrolase family protein [Spongiactinospora sp. TRM90649]|uniref:amidohydrolase n=1 Tax=Spongiactinospora sp. TRM90649 TaxID=3031114 RepID=UPI0023F6D5F5|nr:amidohydrolase family protein [Spongiactinospora sp. TRM90649]MDF5759093.1 amidohydrolase family protein [Spongiactinospora sp. TRM90649]
MAADQSVDADLVAVGGDVLTFDESDGRADGLAVRDGRIAALGDEADLRPFIGPRTRVIDLADRTVIPGINDSHLHAAWLGAVWPETLISEKGLSGHAGRLIADEPARRAAILRAGQVCASFGITSYTEPGLGPGEDEGETGCFTQAVLDTYIALAKEGALTSRVTVLRLFGELDGPSALADVEHGLGAALPPTDPEWLRVAGLKIFADGIPPMRSAWTCHPYPDGTTGGLLVGGDGADERERNLHTMIALAHRDGLQVGVHATGDRSIGSVIDAVEREGGAGARHYVIHGDLVTPEQIARMARLGMGLTTQPMIALATSGMVADALGQDVAGSAWPLAELLAAPVNFTLSSDGPVTTPDWRVQIAAAFRLLGVSGADPALMTRLLRCYTTAPAVQDGAEDWKGSLEPGKAADFCVLAGDPLTASPDALPGVEIDLTIAGGRVVHRREA